MPRSKTRSDRILVAVQFPWQFFCGERGPEVYYRLVSQLEYTAEQLATDEARTSQKGGRCSDPPGPGQ